MSDPITCHCGGRRPAYKSVRSKRFQTQYRRCGSCGALSKTRRWITQERRLSADEITRLGLDGIDSQSFEVLVIVRPK